MKYNFDIPVDRRNTDSLKYDGAESVFGKKDIIPLWVADMDFPTAQPVIDAVCKRAKSGIYGYTLRPSSYFEAVRDWQKKAERLDLRYRSCIFLSGSGSGPGCRYKRIYPQRRCGFIFYAGVSSVF